MPPFLSIKTAENSVQRLNGERGKPGRNEGADSSSWPKSGWGGKSGWPREKKLNRTQGSNYIAGASMYNLPWRKGEMEGWQGCRAYFRG